MGKSCNKYKAPLLQFSGVHSGRLLDESAVLTCMAYVDLNPVRAKMAESLEDSVYTSVHEWIEAERAKIRKFLTAKSADDRESETGGVFATKSTSIHEEGIHASVQRADCLVPIDDALFFEYKLTIDEYLELVDLTGRRVAAGKRGQIDEQLQHDFAVVADRCGSLAAYGRAVWTIVLSRVGTTRKHRRNLV